MLELKGLSKHFGGVRAVDGLDLQVRQGEVFGLIGPNGSGKSTVVNLVCGLFPATAGEVLSRGEDIPASLACARGARNDPHLPEHQAVRQAHRLAEPVGGAEFDRAPAAKAFSAAGLAALAAPGRRSIGSLEFSDLSGKRDELAGNLAFGEQRRLESPASSCEARTAVSR